MIIAQPGYFVKSAIDKLKFIEDLNRLIRCLEIYYSDFIDYGDCKRFKEIASLDINYVLSFNYTDTYQQLYCNGKLAKDRIDFIHGKASLYHSIQECNMVLGIDEYLSDERMNKDNEFIQFKKFYQRIYKGTGCLHVDWLEEAKRANENSQNIGLVPSKHTIYFYGHSLDVTDADIIRRLIMFEGVQTVIFHHNKEALGNQIANLVKVLGEEESIKRTAGTNSAIIFKQSSDETL